LGLDENYDDEYLRNEFFNVLVQLYVAWAPPRSFAVRLTATVSLNSPSESPT
jgi:hypothetical protein